MNLLEKRQIEMSDISNKLSPEENPFSPLDAPDTRYSESRTFLTPLKNDSEAFSERLETCERLDTVQYESAGEDDYDVVR